MYTLEISSSLSQKRLRKVPGKPNRTKQSSQNLVSTRSRNAAMLKIYFTEPFSLLFLETENGPDGSWVFCIHGSVVSAFNG